MLQQALAELRHPTTTPNEIPTPTTTPGPPDQTRDTTTRRKKPQIPNPPKFSRNRQKFQQWHLEMKSKVEIDGEAFESDRAIFAYIYSRLEKTAQSMASAYYAQGGADHRYNPDQFLGYLEGCYGDPNAKAQALARLRVIRQKGHESFAAFLPKFEKELAESGGASWNDEVRINYLDGALNDTLRDALISVVSIPGAYADYTRLLLEIGSRLDSRNHQKRREETRRRPTTPDQTRPKSPVTPKGDKMEWEPTKVNRSIVPEKNKKKKKREDHQKEERRCYKCDKTGHLIKNCPRWEKAKIKKAAPKPAIDDNSTESSEPESDQTSEDSGKE
jgi:hypothetical protein